MALSKLHLPSCRRALSIHWLVYRLIHSTDAQPYSQQRRSQEELEVAGYDFSLHRGTIDGPHLGLLLLPSCQTPSCREQW